MRSSTTIVTKTLKWPVCLMLALLIILQAMPVMATEQKTEQTQTPTVTEVTGSESAESAASGENNEIIIDELEPMDLQEVATTSNSDWTTTEPHEGKVLHGGYVGFKNKASGKYLTIPNGATATGTNVCQQSANSIVNSQEFYLSYTYLPKKSVAYFYIFPVDASTGNAVSNRVKAVYPINSGTSNVNVSYFMPTEMTDNWQIVHSHDNYYYIYIASRPDTTGTKYALTANSGEGTANGTATTATGNVYVSAYTGADNQLWQICVNNDPVNINGINIATETSLSGCAYPGETVAYYYIPKTFNEFVSWLSSSNDTCTIGQFGIIEGAHVGSTTVIANAYNKNLSLISSYTIEFHTLLRDGYYYIQSYYDDYLMDLQGGSTVTGTPIQVWNTGGDVSSNNQIFKLVHVGDGCYNIIPIKLIKEAKGLAWSDETANVLTQKLSDSSGNLSDYCKWKLKCSKYTIDGITYYGVNIYAKTGVAKTITIPESYQNGTDLTTSLIANNRQTWQICGDHVDIVSLWSFGDLVAGEHYDFPVYCVGSFEPMYTEWRLISGYDIVSLDSIHEIGKFTTLRPGVAQVAVRIYSSSAKETLLDSETYTLNVYPSPSEGDFFIQNADSEKILTTSGSTLPGFAVAQVVYADHINHEWEFIHISDNYFRIKSKWSSHYLTAPTNTSGPVTQGAVANDYALWKIIPTSGNRYKIIPKVYETANVVLASPSATSTSLCLTTYTDNTNYLDEWNLLISGSELTILSVADCDAMRAAAAIQAESNAHEYGIDCNLIISDHLSTESVLTGIQTSTVFISRSHGLSDRIQINGQKPRKNGDDLNLYTSDIYDYDSNMVQVDFSNCDIVIFIGCKTAKDRNSIAQAAVNAGASAAIGFKESIEYDDANDWLNAFVTNYYSMNCDLQRAFEETKRQVNDGYTDSVVMISSPISN